MPNLDEPYAKAWFTDGTTAEVVALTFGRARINHYDRSGVFVNDCW